METNISERLVKILEQIHQKEKLEKDLASVQGELSAQSGRLEELSAQLAAEEVDVEKLEKTSLESLFSSILGEREERLEKERQEMLRARLAYQNAQHRLNSLEQEQDYLQRQLDRLQGVETEYQAVLVEKEAYLKGANPQVAESLLEISAQVAEINVGIKEVEEAIAAGGAAVSGLDRMLEALGSAKSWGIFDMVGGGIVSTAVKHSKIDQAHQYASQVEAAMTRFNRELADVVDRAEMQVEISGVEAFADYFLDGLIFDWVVQSKINTALERTKQAKSKVDDALRRLQKIKKADIQARDDLQARRIRLIQES